VTQTDPRDPDFDPGLVVDPDDPDQDRVPSPNGPTNVPEPQE